MTEKVTRRRKPLRWVALGVGLLVVIAAALAPSWRSYYLPRGGVRILEDQVYVPGSANPKHRLDLYLPKRPGPWPVVVFVHGGFWRPLDRRLLQPITGLHGCVGVALANHGVATAVVGYRQYPEAANIDGALDDITQSVRYVLEHIGAHGGDPARVYLVGHSAGGLMTMLLATGSELEERVGVKKDQLRGYASLGGVYDLARVAPRFEAAVAKKVRASAGSEEGLARFSPERRLKPAHPPLLLLVGSRETPALLDEHRQMTAALRSAGGDLTSRELDGPDHMQLIMQLSQPDDRVLSELLAFIASHP